MGKKKILFIGRFPPPIHGASLMNENYYKILSDDKNFAVKSIQINLPSDLNEMGKVNLKRFFWIAKSYLETFRELIFYNPDIIYFEIAPKGFAFYRDSVYALLCKLFGKKIFFNFQAKGVSNAVKNKIAKWYYRLIFKNSGIIILSKMLYSDIKDIAKGEQVSVIPNAVKDELDNSIFREIIKERKKNKIPILLFLSNMIRSKGPLEVLKICNELKEKGISFECFFVGKFQEKEFEKEFFEELKNLGLEKYCKYLGPKYGKEKGEILEKSNYLIFPTTYPQEAFSLVILEALMYGIPVLSYANASVSEVLSEEYLGFVSKKSDWHELAEELEKRLKKKEFSERIRDYFKKNYTLDKSAKKLVEVLK